MRTLSKEAVKKLFEPLKNVWLDEQEIDNLLTDELIECFNKSTSPADINDTFNAFIGLTPEDVKVLIIGKDPYPNTERAHGLAFSFANNHKANDSIKNIFKKIKNDLNINNSDTNLTCWRKRGVLLLNTALTYEKFENKENKNLSEGQIKYRQKKLQEKHIEIWGNFVNIIIEKLIKNRQKNNKPLVIMLWGEDANKIEAVHYEKFIKDNYPNIKILRSSHPSNMGQACKKSILPDSKEKIPAFFDESEDNKQFKICNEFLNGSAIDWSTK